MSGVICDHYYDCGRMGRTKCTEPRVKGIVGKEIECAYEWKETPIWIRNKEVSE